MADVAALTVTARPAVGSRAAAKLRKQGLIPAVVYGHGEPVAHIAVSAEELDKAVRVLHQRTFSLTVEGKADTVLIKELQWDYLGRDMIHVDFERHSLTERVKVTIPIELKNAPKQTGGGVLDQPLHVLHVECPLGNIPTAVTIDLTPLTLGQPVHVSDLKLPEGVVAVDAADAVVVQLKLRGEEVEADLAPDAIEPVVLTAKKPADEA